MRGCVLGLCLLFVGLVGCGDDGVGGQARSGSQAALPDAPGKGSAPRAARNVALGHDLDALKARGELRILVPANVAGGRYLPRKGSPVWEQQGAAAVFAKSLGLRAKRVPVTTLEGLIEGLIEGRGDIVAANLTITPERRKRIAFSVPITHVREQLVVGVDSTVKGLADLSGKVLSVNRGTSYQTQAERLLKRYPSMQVVYRDPGELDEDELDRVAAGTVDATIRDSNLMDMYLAYRNDVRVVHSFKSTRDIAWGLRKDAPKLKAALDHFLYTEKLSESGERVSTADFDEIGKRRVLRVLMRNNAASYFLYKGELMGFEYEMAKAFAKSHKLRLEVIVPPDHKRMIQWLVEGRGDMAVGFLEPLETRRAKGVEFTDPYHYARREVVARVDDPLSRVAELAGRSLIARRSSSYWEALGELRKGGLEFRMIAAPENVETEELVADVGSGKADLTVADSQILAIEVAQGTPVHAAFSLGEKRPHAVAVRRENVKLRAALNKFIKKNYRGTLYNILYKKYFKSRASIKKLAAGRVQALEGGKISPWDKITKRYAAEYGFDWRLLTAQMYQESQFDPKAVSFAGARGLMQVLPRTARSMGFESMDTPEQGIHAGVKYLDWVRERFEPQLSVADRMWFSLASYNAGVGHVKDARRLAAKLGLDPRRWFDNTERTMLLLSKRKYHSKARHGYVRGAEPVNYVRDIRQRFNAYVELTEGPLAALSGK